MGSGVPAASRTSHSTSQGITGSRASGYTKEVANITKSPTAAAYGQPPTQIPKVSVPSLPTRKDAVRNGGIGGGGGGPATPPIPNTGPLEPTTFSQHVPETMTQVMPEPGFGGGGPPPAGARTMTQLMTSTQSPITQEMSTIAQQLGKTKKPKKKKKQHTPSMRL
uniref:Uncharacterized protein n=1 Tax=Romanomermis culicivorax TaxID=13658 RepID=A0A915JJX2_ROMCU